MKVLIIGNGGREHALAWKISQESSVQHVYVAPGNAGTSLENNITNVDIDVLHFEKLTRFAEQKNIDITLVGPELPLVEGIVDYFQNKDLAIFGPTKKAAQLEGSKTFAKEFLKKNQIPTANYQSFIDIELAKKYVLEQNYPLVIKADGLAAGKGVVIAKNKSEAYSAIEHMLSKNLVGGGAGARVVVEDFLEGEEVSFIVMSDGKNSLPFATSQDHKALLDNDSGPNTGGMGAYSPAPIVTDSLHKKIMKQVIEPTISAMKKENMHYTGFLYAGLMIDSQGNPKVLEFNCRFGDPETQPIMMRMQSSLSNLCLLAVQNGLSNAKITWSKQHAVGIVMSSSGYPLNFKTGYKISGEQYFTNSHVKVFQAGTKIENGQLLTDGGRVLCVTALGDNVSLAKKNAEFVLDRIRFNGAHYRRDIGYRAINREMHAH